MGATTEFLVDFSEFWEGSPVEIAGLGSNSWKGGFRGRPQLAEALWPLVSALVLNMRREAACGLRSQLRALFRFLDKYEERFGALVDTLGDISDAMGILWLRPPVDGGWERPNSGTYLSVKKLLSAAKESQETRFWWPPAPVRARPLRDVPSEAEGRALLHALKREVQDIYKRWDRADALAAAGVDVLVPSVGTRARGVALNEADCHATFRGLIARTGDPLPSKRKLGIELGLRSNNSNLPSWWPVNYNDLIAGLYPTSSDAAVLLALFLARSGWNPGTAIALDIQNEAWAQPLGDGAPALWWVQSFKVRSNTWQDTVSPEKLSTGCYQIVARMIKRTAALRDLVRADESRALLPELALRSPWLSAELGTTQVCVTSHVIPLNRVIARVTDKANARAAELRGTSPPTSTGTETRGASTVVTIRNGITSTDFRDIFAGFVFRDSRYAWTLAQWALGHKHPSTTRRYLRSRAWREHTREALSRFGTILFDEIEVHRRVDPVLLRARAAGYSLLPSQVTQLEDWRRRTYLGMGCLDPTLPDPSIDPTHPRDGVTTCANTHRCVSCTQGVVFDDSLEHLARRLAELNWLQKHASLASWSESTHPADVAVLTATLRQWPSDVVAREVDLWAGRLESGEHRAIRFGGTH